MQFVVFVRFIVEFTINETLLNGRGNLALRWVAFVIGVWGEKSHQLSGLL